MGVIEQGGDDGAIQLDQHESTAVAGGLAGATVPGSFAHALHHLIEQLDLSAFDAHYRNDNSGAGAYMTRQPRLDLPGMPQHVVRRGNDRQPCFFTKIDRVRYLDELIKCTLTRVLA